MNRDIQIGLRQPQKPVTTCDEMRLAIERASRDSGLIHNCLNMAQYRGMSGEDKYVLLAYQALLELERHWKRNLEFVNLDVSAKTFVVNPAPDAAAPMVPSGICGELFVTR